MILLSKDIADLGQIPYSVSVMLAPEKGHVCQSIESIQIRWFGLYEQGRLYTLLIIRFVRCLSK